MAEKNDSAFGKQYSVSQFKQMMGADTLDVVKNPNTGKVFFTWGGDTRGKVAHDALEAEHKVITETFDDNGEMSYCLMKKSENNIVASL